MSERHPARLLRVHISEDDRFDGKPLYEAIVTKCREMNIAGATVFRGLEGYGEKTELHRHQFMHHNQPMIVTIVDTGDKVARLALEVEKMMDTGLIASEDVQVIRVLSAGD